MAVQHADQYVASLYDTSRPNWTTLQSSYARRYMEFRLGQRGKQPDVPAGMPGADCIRERVDRELAR